MSTPPPQLPMMSDLMGEIQEDLKNLTNKVELRFGQVESKLGKVDEIIMDLKSGVEELRNMAEQLREDFKRDISKREKELTILNMDQETVDTDIETLGLNEDCELSGEELMFPRSTKEEEEKQQMKTKNIMALGSVGGRGKIQDYFSKNKKQVAQGISNLRDSFKKVKSDMKVREGCTGKGKGDQKKRRRNDSGREDEGGVLKGGILFVKKSGTKVKEVLRE